MRVRSKHPFLKLTGKAQLSEPQKNCLGIISDKKVNAQLYSTRFLYFYYLVLSNVWMMSLFFQCTNMHYVFGNTPGHSSGIGIPATLLSITKPTGASRHVDFEVTSTIKNAEGGAEER